MNTASITATTDSKPRMRGFALISVIAALMLTLFLEALDQTIVGTALPRIIEELHGLDRYSWVVTAYILATMTMIPIVGKLSDQFGRKWFLLSGATLFLLGSILAGASQSMDQLIIFRAVPVYQKNDRISLQGPGHLSIWERWVMKRSFPRCPCCLKVNDSLLSCSSGRAYERQTSPVYTGE